MLCNIHIYILHIYIYIHTQIIELSYAMYYTYYTYIYIYILYRYDIYVSEESWAAASQSPGQSPSAVLSPSVGSPHHSEPEPEQSAQQLQAALGECWWFGDLGGTLCKTGALEMKST